MRHIKPSSMWVSLVVFLPLFWKGITSQDIYHPGYSIEVSSSVSVHEGLCVTIPCTFTADNRRTFTNSFGYWIQTTSNQEFIVATNDKSSVVRKTNFHLTGNPDSGDCTLTIADARKEDAGTYFFRFEESKYSPVRYGYSRERTITITVTDLTEEPIISDIETVIAGINKTVTCAPPGNCSATSLVFQWKKSNVAGIWKNSSTVTFTPSLNDHQKNITCEMTNSQGKTTQKAILLNVCYPPRNVKITIHSSKGGELPASPQVVINQTETLTLICRADGNPPVTVVWEKGELDPKTNKTSDSGLSAVINVTSSMADVYRCVAWNALGLRERRIQVVIKQGSAAEQKTCDEISYRDIAIGFICGMIISTFIILLYKLIIRKKISKKKIHAVAKEPPASEEATTNEIYMNDSKNGQKAEGQEEATSKNIQLDSSDTTSNQDDLHYSIIAFTAKPSKVPSCQPETEYAEIQEIRNK